MDHPLLSNEAQAFLRTLHQRFHVERKDVLGTRVSHYPVAPAFLEETKGIRADPAWRGAPLAPGLIDRRVEITGPAAPRKMVIHALNSHATQYMCDFEDSMAPTWANIMEGHQNVKDAIHRTIRVEEKSLELRKGALPTLLVRPRGWHMEESNFAVDGTPMSASLFDVGLYLFHCAKQSIAIGQGPYFYLPKMEQYTEARLWSRVFSFSEETLGLPRHCIRATCLIETLPAVFQMEEILYELRHYSAGLNTGRWDYIFSFIKKLRYLPEFVTPDRSQLTMTTPFLTAYSHLLIQTCHRRKVHAIGGMSAFVPLRGDAAANVRAEEHVRADKLREVRDGYDGTWVLHPDFVKVARSVFDEHMPKENQFQCVPGHTITAADLLHQTGISSSVTLAGIRHNVKACLLYVESWRKGVGSVAVDGLMEDLATMEISRTQLWQWLYHKIITMDQCRGYIREISEQYSISADTIGICYQLIDPAFFYDFTSTAMPVLLRNNTLTSSL